MKRVMLSLGLALVMVLGSGCASLSGPANGRIASPSDPLEGLNRATFAFNEALDKVFFKPVAQGYEAVVPPVFRGMVTNFFGNLADAWTSVNQLAQGKPVMAFKDASRVVINSFFGFGGIADVASEMGIEKSREDFGQTLGVWGLAPGPYLVLPVFGPSTLRDTSALPVDFFGDPVLYQTEGVRLGLGVGRLINLRANLLPSERVANSIALDKYSFFRDAYLQRRRNLVYDGNPPEPKD